MNEDIFAEIADQLRPDPQVRARLFAEIDATPTLLPPPPRRRGRLAWVAGAAAVALVAGLAVLPSLVPKGHDLSDPPAVLPPAASRPPSEARDYAGAYSAVQRAFDAAPQDNYWKQFGRMPVGGALEFAASAESVGLQTTSGTWATNRQVAGIDEGDVVKSDGHTIFTASGRDVVLVSADGADTTEVARIDTTAEETGPTAGTVQGPVAELLLHGTSLVVMVTEYTPRLSALPSSEPLTYVPYDASQTRALIYDVSDPTRPRFVTSLGQSGAYVTARLSGDVAYLVTSYALTDRQAVERDEPATFVPSLFDGADRIPVGAADLGFMDNPQGPSYTVVSSLDLANRRRVDTHSVLGETGISYMSTDSLFLTSTTYASTPMSTFGPVAATDLRNVGQTTQLVRIALDGGRLSAGGEASLPGTPVNQFALDEYDSHLRIAVTMTGATTAGGWATYPALFVLDDDLSIVGSLPQLAVNEQIQSVRFDGPLAYVVTFRQVDPLFAIDLSTPASPKVMSALKIPGFSTYLHPWSEGRLLGLGMEASDTGRVTGMKLSMFDTSDPFDVTEAATLKVNTVDAEANHNHKAVFVDPDRHLIGFPVGMVDAEGQGTSHYLLYRYDEGRGFTQLGSLPVQPSSSDLPATARGMTIDGYLYVASPAGVDVYRVDPLTKVVAHRFGNG